MRAHEAVVAGWAANPLLHEQPTKSVSSESRCARSRQVGRPAVGRVEPARAKRGMSGACGQAGEEERRGRAWEAVVACAGRAGAVGAGDRACARRPGAQRSGMGSDARERGRDACP